MDKIRPELFPKVALRFAALADENRLRLLLRLKTAPANVTTLSDELGIAQASVSKHLAVLRQAGLLDVDRQGNQAFYSVRDQSVFDMCRIVCDGVVRFAQEEHAAMGLSAPPRRAQKASPR